MKRAVDVFCGNGYVFNEEKEQLEYFVAESAAVDFSNGKVKYEGKIAGVPVTMEGCNLKIYQTVDDFKRGNPDMITMSLTDTMAALYGFTPSWEGEEGNKQPKAWIFEDGDARKATIFDFKVRIDMADDKFRLKECGRQIYYGSRESIFRCHDLKVMGEDGLRYTKKSLKSRLELSDEQKKVVEMLRDTLGSMKAVGLKALLDEDKNELMIIPMDKLEDFTQYETEGYELVNRSVTRRIECDEIERMYDYPWVKLKEE